MWENIVERGRPHMTTWRMRNACWIPKTTNIQTGCVIPFVFSTTTMAARTRLNVKLYAHCLSCWFLPRRVRVYPNVLTYQCGSQ